MAKQVDIEVQRGIQKAMWLMCVAMNEAEGIGAVRITRILHALDEVATQYGGYKADGVADEILMRRIRQMGLEIETLYGGENNA